MASAGQQSAGSSSAGGGQSLIPETELRRLRGRDATERSRGATAIGHIVRGLLIENKQGAADVIRVFTDLQMGQQDLLAIMGAMAVIKELARVLTQAQLEPHVAEMLRATMEVVGAREPELRLQGVEALFELCKTSRSAMATDPVLVRILFVAVARLHQDDDLRVVGAAQRLNELLREVVYQAGEDFDVAGFLPVLLQVCQSTSKDLSLLMVWWLQALDNVPGIDMVVFLSEFVDRLLELLATSTRAPEVSDAAAQALERFYAIVETLAPDELLRGINAPAVVAKLVQQVESGPTYPRRVALRWTRLVTERCGRGAARMLPSTVKAVLLAASDEDAAVQEEAQGVNRVLMGLARLMSEGEGRPMGGVAAVASGASVTVGRGGALGEASAGQSGGLEGGSSSGAGAEKRSGASGSGAAAASAGAATAAVSAGNGDQAAGSDEEEDADPSGGGRLQPTDIRMLVEMVTKYVSSDSKLCRAWSLAWLLLLLELYPGHVMSAVDSVSLPLLTNVSNESISEGELGSHLEVLGAMCQVDPAAFRGRLLRSVLEQLRTRERLRETRGAKILRHLCDLLDSRATYVTLARLLRGADSRDAGASSDSPGETLVTASAQAASTAVTDAARRDGHRISSPSKFERRFVNLMVDMLSLLLLTAPELVGLRDELRGGAKSGTSSTSGAQASSGAATGGPDGTDLFQELFLSWSASPVATFMLCLLAGRYELARAVIQRVGEREVTVGTLMHCDQAVQLIESPVFVALRMQLLQPWRPDHQQLVGALYGLLMLLPQSPAYVTLRDRLGAVASMHVAMTVSGSHAGAVAPGELSEQDKRLLEWHDRRKGEMRSRGGSSSGRAHVLAELDGVEEGTGRQRLQG